MVDGGVEWLINAINRKDLAETRRLLEAGVNPNGSDRIQTICLAILGRNLPIIKLLLEHGADVLSEGACGNRALMLAQRCKNTEIAFLIKNSIDRQRRSLATSNDRG